MIPLTTLTTGNGSHRIPVSTAVAPATVEGRTANRLMVLLRAPGCAYRRTGCTYCGFDRLTTLGEPVSADDLAAQVEAALGRHDCTRQDIRELDLYNSGNFFNEAEIPTSARALIAMRCARETNLRRVLVDSRPEFISRERVTAWREAAHWPSHVRLEVGIGFDAFDDDIRMTGLRKTFTREDFERAVRVIGEAGLGLLSYAMLKPMPMPDAEALIDVQRAAGYVRDVATQYNVPVRIALEPAFVVPGTQLSIDYLEGRFTPPSLWLVRNAVRSISGGGEVNIGLWDEDLEPLAKSASCPSCQDRLIEALKKFNATQEIRSLDIAPCRCASGSDVSSNGTWQFDESKSKIKIQAR